MSVPTKTGQDIWKDIEAYELKYHTLSNLRKQKWMLLEDHQKDIQRREKLREEYYKDWLSPEQITDKIAKIKAEIFSLEFMNILENSEKKELFEIINVFGVGGAK